MEIIYKAFDGNLFTSEAECVRYEAELNLFPVMLDLNLKPTKSWEDCYFAYYKDIATLKASWKYNMCEDLQLAIGANTEDELDVYDTGLYYWDEWLDNWKKLDLTLFGQLNLVLAKIQNGEI